MTWLFYMVKSIRMKLTYTMIKNSEDKHKYRERGTILTKMDDDSSYR